MHGIAKGIERNSEREFSDIEKRIADRYRYTTTNVTNNDKIIFPKRKIPKYPESIRGT
jgi:hypothetical protein